MCVCSLSQKSCAGLCSNHSEWKAVSVLIDPSELQYRSESVCALSRLLTMCERLLTEQLRSSCVRVCEALKACLKEKAIKQRGCKQERLIGCWKSSPASRTRALESAITARKPVQIHNGPKTPNNNELILKAVFATDAGTMGVNRLLTAASKK